MIALNQSTEPLEVQVFLPDAVIKGSTNLSPGRWRLGEALNTQETYLELKEATIQRSGGNFASPSIAIDKRDIVFAIPQETPEHLRSRRMANLGSRTETARIKIVALASTYLVEGSAHSLPGTQMPRVITASPAYFPHFLSVTDCRVTDAEGQALEAEFVLLNREKITVLSGG